MERNLIAGLFHASASLGIAEAAVRRGHRGRCAERGEPDARARMLIAENAIELGACRATIARGGVADRRAVRRPTRRPTRPTRT